MNSFISSASRFRLSEAEWKNHRKENWSDVNYEKYIENNGYWKLISKGMQKMANAMSNVIYIFNGKDITMNNMSLQPCLLFYFTGVWGDVCFGSIIERGSYCKGHKNSI